MIANLAALQVVRPLQNTAAQPAMVKSMIEAKTLWS